MKRGRAPRTQANQQALRPASVLTPHPSTVLPVEQMSDCFPRAFALLDQVLQREEVLKRLPDLFPRKELVAEEALAQGLGRQVYVDDLVRQAQHMVGNKALCLETGDPSQGA